MEQEVASLLLNTYDISQVVSTPTVFYNKTVDNQYGRIENNRCTITWKNINMKQVLGEMYDKYETFNLKLYQITQTTTMINSSSAIAGVTSLCDVRISGLPFLDGYNVVSRNKPNEVYLTSFNLSVQNYTFTGIVVASNPVSLTFGKCTEFVNITIDIKLTKDQQYPVINLNTALGQFLFNFKIVGIPSRKNIITNGNRIFQ